MITSRFHTSADIIAFTTAMICLGLTGCASNATRHLTHSVQVFEWESAFHQSRHIESFSLQLLSDAQQYQWPHGLTLSATGMRSTVTDAARQWLEFRHDALRPGSDAEAIYEQARHLREQLTQTCSTISMVADGQPFTVPVGSITVRILTDHDRMPIPPTDQDPDRVADVVSNNPSDKLVMSAKVMAQPDPEQFARLAAARTLEYEVCGHGAQARPAELAGLKRVYAWVSSKN